MSKQALTRRTVATMIACVLPAIGATAQQDANRQSENKQPPNIVYIISDDQGWKDVGFHGSDIRTPNIDALAKGGARLEQFYAQPMCTPTRAALMTRRLRSRGVK